MNMGFRNIIFENDFGSVFSYNDDEGRPIFEKNDREAWASLSLICGIIP